MSYCVSYGKDKVSFLTEEDLKGPSSIVLPESDEPRGAILPNGDINWECPCFGNAVIGPCSVEFRAAFTCLQESTADPRGSDCLPPFREMSECFTLYPHHYPAQEEGADRALRSLEEEEEVIHGASEETNAKEANDRTQPVEELTKS